MEMKENHSTMKHSGNGKGAPRGSTLHLEGAGGIDQSAWILEGSCWPCSQHAAQLLHSLPCFQPFPQKISLSGEHGCRTSKHFRTFCLEWRLKPRCLFMIGSLLSSTECFVCALLLLCPTFIFFSFFLLSSFS